MELKQIDISDYEEIYEFWKTDSHIRLSEADSYYNISKFLERNPRSNYVIKENNKIIGTILCGNDGRRGYIHHLLVDKDYRKMGYGKILVEKGLNAFKKLGITKSHIFIAGDNNQGEEFWKKMGFYKRNQNDILLYSKDLK